jgi:hypothetical protein
VLRDAKAYHRATTRRHEVEKRRKDVPRGLHLLWLKENPSPPKLQKSLNTFGIDFERQKAEFTSETKNEPEGKLLQLIFSDLSKLLPNHLSARKQFVATNLLRSIVSLHGEGAQQGRMAERDYLRKCYPKKMREIDEHEISKHTRWIFAVKNKQANQLRAFVERTYANLIRTRNGKLLLRKNTALTERDRASIQFTIEQTYTLSEKQAFVQACEQNGVRYTGQAWNRHRKRQEATRHRP